MTNGLNWELEKKQSSPEDWVFGSTSQKCLASIPENERIEYLPKGEVQRGKEDMSDCATRGPINILETKFNWLIKKGILMPENEQWLSDNGYLTKNGIEFSDAFIAITSGTTREGNSLKAPLEAIRKNGLIPKKLLPFDKDMTWEEYHNPSRITGSMYALGQQFIQRFSINYERVFSNNYETLLKDDLLNVAGFAWPTPVNGIYQRDDRDPNHVWVNFKNKYYAFDNYLDVDKDFIKQLAEDYKFVDYGYRLFITENPKSQRNWLLGMLKTSLELLKELLDLLNGKTLKTA